MPRTKTGTLTFHQAISYGAALQAYALQQVLLEIGVENELIDYRCEYLDAIYRETPKSIRKLAGRILRLPWRKRRILRFESFLNCFIKMGAPQTRSSIPDACRAYDKVIVGSDQIWNPDLTGFDRTYFLDFLNEPSKKASYAASIGTSGWAHDSEDECVALISDFPFVSVREKSAADYLAGLLGTRPFVACDPTLLLDASKWRSVAASTKMRKPYLLVYSIGKLQQDFFDWAKRIADQRNWDMVVIHEGALPYQGVVNIQDAGPREFLGLIDKATYFVTNSFHGICFSIIFEKQFSWFRSKTEDSSISGRSSRIEDLLNELHLAERAVTEVDALPAEFDYLPVKRMLSNIQIASLAYLVSVVDGGEPDVNAFGVPQRPIE